MPTRKNQSTLGDPVQYALCDTISKTKHKNQKGRVMCREVNRALSACNKMSVKVMNNFESEVVQVIETQNRGLGVDEVASALRFRYSDVNRKVVAEALKKLVDKKQLSEEQGVFRNVE